jgi:hypothetical protein
MSPGKLWNFNDTTPAAPPGRVNIQLQGDPVTGNISGNVAASGTSGSTAVAVVVEIALAPGAPGNFTVAHGLPAAPAFVLIQMDSGGDIYFQTARYDATNLYLTASDAGIVGKAQCWLLAASAEIPFTSSIGNFSVPHGLGVTPVLIQIQRTAGGAVWLQTPNADATNVFLTGSDAGITGFLEVWKILPIPVSSNYARVTLAPGAPGNFSVAHGLGAVPFLAEINMTSGGEIWFQTTRFDQTNLLLVASDAGITGYADVWAAAPSSALSFPVTAAQGGTGLTTLTAHAVLLGEGTSPIAFASPGSSGQVLTSNGASADPSFQAAPAGAVSSVFGRTGAVVATSGDYTAAQVTNAASQAGVQGESYSYAADTGAANAYVAAFSPVVGSYVAGQRFAVKAAHANTTSSTLDAGAGTKTIKKLDGATNLASGDIAAGQIFVVEYDGTNFQLISPVATAGGGGAPTTSKYILGDFDGSLANATKNSTAAIGPDSCPASPNTMNDEFDDTSGNSGTGNGLNARWAWRNQGSTTLAYGAGFAQFAFVSNGASHVARFIKQSLPSAPYTFIGKLNVHLTAAFSAGGLFLYESATAKWLCWGFDFNSGVYQLGLLTSAGSLVFSSTISNIPGPPQVFLQINRTSTTLTFSSSLDGITYDSQITRTITTDFTTAPDEIGVGGDPYQQIMNTNIDFFRRTL